MKNGILSIVAVSILIMLSVLKSNTAVAGNIFGLPHIDPIVLIPFVGPTIAAGKAVDAVSETLTGETIIGDKIYNEIAAYGNLSTDALKAVVRGDINELLRVGVAALARTGLLNSISDQLMAAIYREYIAQSVNDPASPTIRLHPNFIAIYRDDFKEDLRNVSIRISKQTNTSLTDCRVIHFQRGAVATNVFAQITANSVGGMPFPSSGNHPDSYLKLVLHELEHVDQCKQIGGRQNYGANWFYNLVISGVLQPATLFLTGPIGPLAYLATVNGNVIHDAMPLEINAEAEAIKNADSHLTAAVPTATDTQSVASSNNPQVITAFH